MYSTFPNLNMNYCLHLPTIYFSFFYKLKIRMNMKGDSPVEASDYLFILIFMLDEYQPWINPSTTRKNKYL